MGNCADNMYWMSVFAEKLNIQNCENSTRNCVYYMYRMSGLVEKNKLPELRIFNGKLCALYMYGKYRLVEKLNVQNCVNWTENSIQNIYGMSGFVKTLNILNYENSTGNCVHYMHWMSRLAEKLNIQNCV